MENSKFLSAILPEEYYYKKRLKRKNNKFITYEGEYLNELKHGFGREYIKGERLGYEGFWSNNLFHGNGKMYRGDGSIEYDGEWCNCYGHGNGRIYNKNGKIQYEGEWINNLPHGYGKKFDENGNVIYEGQYSNGLKNGKGKEYINGKLLYDGEWINGFRHGQGKEFDENGNIIYEGIWINNQKTPEKNILIDNLDPLEELNSLIGLEGVKEDVNKLINFIKVQNLRKEKGMVIPNLSLHLVFTGNPGTGKTTVARLIAKIYKNLGILSSGHLVEVDRSDLVGEYVGQTAPKVKKKIKEALGGVLFIDEAYSLYSESGMDYGHEAINTLLKEMEDNRDNLIVIVAGYKNEMKKFIKSNPGLESRFNKFIHFHNYSSKDLCKILTYFCNKNYYTLDESTYDYLIKQFKHFKENDKNFANARFVRNLFEKMIITHSSRIINLDNIDDYLDKFELIDIQEAFAI
ncbi:MAG: stage sporulation protein [Fusobacteriaceae bacterium]|nr:stage sporulation protein [Fusobacteriaceae bacterium]